MGEQSAAGSTGLAPSLERLVVAAALALVTLGFVGAVVALLGAWQPLVAATVLLLSLAVGWRASAWVPRPGLAGGHRPGRWPMLALLAVVLGVTLWTGATSSEQVLPRRDSASYLQATIALTGTGDRPVPVDVETIGGPEALTIEGLTLESPAFYETGSADDPVVQPQFMPGPALSYSLPWWLGAGATFWAPAVAGGLALLAVGLLVARTVGPWWGASAALLVGACFPWLHTSRSTYSEPLAGLTLAAGFLLLTLVTAKGEEGTPSPAGRDRSLRVAALLAGLLVGGTSVVRIDALRETMLLLPVAALLLARGRGWGRDLLVGAGTSTLVGFVVAGVMSWRYLGEIGASLLPLVALVLLMGLVCWWLLRRSRAGWSLPTGVTARLPAALGVLVVVVGVGLALRPLVMTARQDPSDPGAMYVARMQAQQGLTVDGGRTYAEMSVAWLAWWVGPVALVVALVVLALLARRLGSWWAAGPSPALPAWGPALVVVTGSTLLTLWRPGITPDHPWADRRLLVALPLVLVLLVAGAAGARRWLAARGPAAAATAGGLAVLAGGAVPVALATAPHATERIEAGELAAVEQVCAALGPDDVVLAVDDWAVNQWPQVARGQCATPALATTGALRDDPAAVADAAARLERLVGERGGRVLLLASRSEDSLTELGAQDVRQVVDVTVEEDMRVLEERPDGTTPLPIEVWTGRVAR